MKPFALVLLLLAAVTTGCATTINGGGGLTTESLTQTASAWPLQIGEGHVYTDNDAAFASKLRMIEGARTSIDLSYYIFTDDESSSKLIKALLDATRRGVTVRLLVDYATNYNDLDLLSMMQAEGNGRLQVRLYGRPTANIVKDAVFLTMGCGKQTAPRPPAGCSAEKFAAIDKLFADERIDGVPAAGRNISNLNIGNSGLFLSGLYAKQADVVALAVEKGQGIDLQQLKGQGTSASPEEKERLKKLGKEYWVSRTGAPFQQLEAKTNLFFAFLFFGQQLNPLKETVTSLLPVDRTLGQDEIRDWDHFTDYTHHKFLLVDRKAVQLGGRNVENSYHMHPDPLTGKKYVFMDTDLSATFTQGGDAVAQAFENIWNFSPMVATLGEVRQHAPNDFVVNMKYAERACASQHAKPAHDKCVATEMETHVHDLAQRMAEVKRNVEANARTYDTRYRPTPPAQAAPSFTLDQGSLLAYLENLPFDSQLPPEKRQRIYGASAGKEAQSGKHIHDAWLRALPAVCAAATPGNPKRIILHQAYFLPPANLTYAMSRLVDGTYDCSNVTVTVLTNSIETTDLNVVNFFAGQVLKAFTEFYQQHSVRARRAAFEYYEYQKPAHGPSSLHTKVSVFGDDIIIGSANADVRSFMMDSNNAMLVRNAPNFAQAYLAYLQRILADPAKSRKLNDYYANNPRSSIVDQTRADFRKQILEKYGVDKKASAEELKAIEAKFAQLLDDAYQMTRDSISPDLSAAKRRENQDHFNELFKPL